MHGTTHQRPLDRFAHEQLTPLGPRPPYHYQRVRLRQVANDAWWQSARRAIQCQVEFVGLTVGVHETPDHYEIFHQERLVARHPKAARHSVVMEPAHYAGLLRVGRRMPQAARPRFDPNFSRLGEMMVRDLSLYNAIGQGQEGGAQ